MCFLKGGHRLEVLQMMLIKSNQTGLGDVESGHKLGGGFQIYSLFSPLLGEDSHFDLCNMFQLG